jgi:hypothetical protein
MKVDVSTAPVVRCEMKYRLHPFGRPPASFLVEKISQDEVDTSVVYVRLDVLEATATEVVDNPRFGTSLEQRLDKVRSNK